MTGEDPAVRVARSPRRLVVLSWLVLGSAAVFGFAEFRPDLLAALGGLALFVLAAILIGILLTLWTAHALKMILLPYDLAKDAIALMRTRQGQREFAMSLASGGPSRVQAPHATKALVWGIAGVLFPLVAPIALFYGWDSMRLVRMSGGNLAGSRRARIGLVLGVTGTLEFFGLLVVGNILWEQ